MPSRVSKDVADLGGYAVLLSDPSEYLYRVRATKRENVRIAGPPLYVVKIQLADSIMGDHWFTVGKDVRLITPLELLAKQAQ